MTTAEKLRAAIEQDAIAYCLPCHDPGYKGLTYVGGLPRAVAVSLCDTLGITRDVERTIRGCVIRWGPEVPPNPDLYRAADALGAILDIAGR
jgi:hypothetical protein